MSYLDAQHIQGSEYLVEVLYWMKQEENRHGAKYKNTSPQKGKRGKLIEWMRNVSCKLGLADATFHLATKLLDLFMDGHDIMVINVIALQDNSIIMNIIVVLSAGSSALLGLFSLG